jgi:acyl-[acyl-carrier-protein]-phospholipid O-acyltransferase/long-chain-fatty-acid--[acyl-carrier-protein] ligase
MTEGSPVVACNLFDDPPSKINPDGVLGRRVGSVGRMVPGIQRAHPRSRHEQDLGIFQSGMLWLRGANVFEGYFKDDRPDHRRAARTAGTRPATWAGSTRTASSSSRAA